MALSVENFAQARFLLLNIKQFLHLQIAWEYIVTNSVYDDKQFLPFSTHTVCALAMCCEVDYGCSLVSQ